MTELQKEYCEEKGLIYINPENTQITDYVNWLEAQIQALRINDVSGRSEQLEAICEHVNFVLEANVERFTVDDLQNIIKSV